MKIWQMATAALVIVGGIAPAQAKEGDVLVRLRAIVVAPTDSSDAVQPSFPGGKVDVGASVMPEVDITYMATNHVGVELIASSTRHEAKGRGTLTGIDPLASTWVLPPTLTLQYHLAPDSNIRPYVGAGINYSIFYSTKAGDALEAVVGPTKVKLNDSVGYALQAGVDVDITPKFFFNFDVKYIDMDPKARLNSGGAINTTRFHIDPVVVGIGLGTRF